MLNIHVDIHMHMHMHKGVNVYGNGLAICSYIPIQYIFIS